MNDWIRELVSEKQRREQAAAEEARKRDLAMKAYDEKVDDFWATFLKHLRGLVDEFNSLVQPADQIEVKAQESATLALRNNGNYSGQFVARLDKRERRAEVDVVTGRSVTVFDCPIDVNLDSQSLELGFKSAKGQLYDGKAAARILLEPYFKWILGSLEAPPPDKRRIGFGS